MGNCLKSASEDDNISFFRENTETSPRESVDQGIIDFLSLYYYFPPFTSLCYAIFVVLSRVYM